MSEALRQTVSDEGQGRTAPSSEHNKTEGALILDDEFFSRAKHSVQPEPEQNQQEPVELPTEPKERKKPKMASEKREKPIASAPRKKPAVQEKPPVQEELPVQEEPPIQEKLPVQEELETAEEFAAPWQDAAPQAQPAEPEEKPTRRKREKKQKREKPHRSGWKKALRVLTVIWVLEFLYWLAAISPIPFIAELRTTYIQTAFETMTHRWLAEYFIPPTIVNPIRENINQTLKQQQGVISKRPDDPNSDALNPTSPTHEGQTDEEKFYSLFWEIDPDSMNEYLARNPEALSGGWEQLYINEAGLDDEGTSIRTIFGEQVLAIDMPNQILLIRVEGPAYRGVLAVGKDATQLRMGAAETIGSYGQYAGTIAQNNGGVLSMTGGGFIDPEGQGNGGELAGLAVCEGVSYGTSYTWEYKRIELHENNRMYVNDVTNPVSEGTTDACEFTPALIVDGEVIIKPTDAWNGMNPRACIGQSVDGEFLMLVIEGREVFDGILGTSTYECATILSRHKGYQAINLDGGSSAIMWYDGEYITNCSNGSLEGRPLPCAWVYGNYDQP